jgi:hypothetical protein
VVLALPGREHHQRNVRILERLQVRGVYDVLRTAIERVDGGPAAQVSMIGKGSNDPGSGLQFALDLAERNSAVPREQPQDTPCERFAAAIRSVRALGRER